MDLKEVYAKKLAKQIHEFNAQQNKESNEWQVVKDQNFYEKFYDILNNFGNNYYNSIQIYDDKLYINKNLMTFNV